MQLLSLRQRVLWFEGVVGKNVIMSNWCAYICKNLQCFLLNDGKRLYKSAFRRGIGHYDIILDDECAGMQCPLLTCCAWWGLGLGQQVFQRRRHCCNIVRFTNRRRSLAYEAAYSERTRCNNDLYRRCQ